jgi:hypothetical protein
MSFGRVWYADLNAAAFVGTRVSFGCAEHPPATLRLKSRTLIRFFDDVPDSVQRTVNPWLMLENRESLPAGCQMKT